MNNSTQKQVSLSAKSVYFMKEGCVWRNSLFDNGYICRIILTDERT